MTRDDRDAAIRRDAPHASEGDDAAWLARVRDDWGPEPMTPAERTAFDSRLAERIATAQRRRHVWTLARPALAVAIALALWLVASSPAPERPQEPTTMASSNPQAAGTRPASLRAWQRQLMTAPDPSGAGEAQLPADYRALDSLFMAGGRGDDDAR